MCQRPFTFLNLRLKYSPVRFTVQPLSNSHTLKGKDWLVKNGDCIRETKPTILRMAKTLWNFGHSEFSRVKHSVNLHFRALTKEIKALTKIYQHENIYCR